METKPYTKCFVICTTKGSGQKLFHFLEKQNIELLGFPVASPIAVNDPDNVVDQMRQADLVVLVLENSGSVANLMVELGIAIALKKHIVAFIEQEIPIPSLLQRNKVIRFSKEINEETLFSLKYVLPTIQKEKSEKRKKLNKDSIGNSLSTKLRLQLDSSSGKGLESWVKEVLFAANIGVVSEAQPGKSMWDFSVWDDKLGRILSAPILIEVKDNIASRQQEGDVLIRLHDYLKSTNCRFGVVVYKVGDPKNKVINFTDENHYILLVSAEELLKAVDLQSFSEFILSFFKLHTGMEVENASL